VSAANQRRKSYDAIRSMDDHVDQAFSTKSTGQG